MGWTSDPPPSSHVFMIDRCHGTTASEIVGAHVVKTRTSGISLVVNDNSCYQSGRSLQQNVFLAPRKKKGRQAERWFNEVSRLCSCCTRNGDADKTTWRGTDVGTPLRCLSHAAAHMPRGLRVTKRRMLLVDYLCNIPLLPARDAVRTSSTKLLTPAK